MICFGNPGPEICETREQVLGFGTIMAFVPTDLIVRFWLGSGQHVDFLAGECKAQDGSRFIFGRLRFHMDDEIFSKRDRKEVLSIGAGPRVSSAEWAIAVASFLQVVEGRIDTLRAIDVNGPPDVFMEKFTSLAPSFGFHLGFKECKLEEDGS